MISYLLARKILELFIFVFLGFFLTKIGLLTTDDTVTLSKIALYLLVPCAIVMSFQINIGSEYVIEMGFSLMLAFIVHIMFVILGRLFRKLFSGMAVEEGSIIYSNAGNLVIPIVASVLGEKWVIFTSTYIVVFNLFMWTHGVWLFTNEGKSETKRILNANIFSIFVGLITLIANIEFPPILFNAVSDLGEFLGPMSMLITGMIIGRIKFQHVLEHRRVVLVMLMRLIVFPFLVLCLFKVTNMSAFVENAKGIMLVSFIAAAAPSGASISQFAIIYKSDEEYAGIINVMTTLACIITMPLMVNIFELWIN